MGYGHLHRRHQGDLADDAVRAQDPIDGNDVDHDEAAFERRHPRGLGRDNSTGLPPPMGMRGMTMGMGMGIPSMGYLSMSGRGMPPPSMAGHPTNYGPAARRNPPPSNDAAAADDDIDENPPRRGPLRARSALDHRRMTAASEAASAAAIDAAIDDLTRQKNMFLRQQRQWQQRRQSGEGEDTIERGRPAGRREEDDGGTYLDEEDEEGAGAANERGRRTKQPTALPLAEYAGPINSYAQAFVDRCAARMAARGGDFVEEGGPAGRRGRGDGAGMEDAGAVDEGPLAAAAMAKAIIKGEVGYGYDRDYGYERRRRPGGYGGGMDVGMGMGMGLGMDVWNRGNFSNPYASGGMGVGMGMGMGLGMGLASDPYSLDRSAFPPSFHRTRGSMSSFYRDDNSISAGSAGASASATSNGPATNGAKSGAANGAANGATTANKWWVCEFCNNKAFVSRVELDRHESICWQKPASNFADDRVAAAAAGMPTATKMESDSDPSLLSAVAATGAANRRMNYLDRSESMRMDPAHYPLLRSQMPRNGDASTGMGRMPTDFDRPPASRIPPTARPPPNSKTKHHLRRPQLPPSPALLLSSRGPFATLSEPIPLSLPDDKDWLTPLHCFVRRHCVQVFTATEDDVKTPSKGKRKPIQIGQVGIRCPHCHAHRSNAAPSSSQAKNGKTNSKTNAKGKTNVKTDDADPTAHHERGSVYYPTSLSSIYNATMNLLQRHLHSCAHVPSSVMEKYLELKKDDARSGTSKKYWVESAKSLGFVDTVAGIRLREVEGGSGGVKMNGEGDVEVEGKGGKWSGRRVMMEMSEGQKEEGARGRRDSDDFYGCESNAVEREKEGAWNGKETKKEQKQESKKEDLVEVQCKKEENEGNGKDTDTSEKTTEVKKEEAETKGSKSKKEGKNEVVAKNDNDQSSKDQTDDDNKDNNSSDPQQIDDDDTNAHTTTTDAPPLVIPSDKATATAFSFLLLSQMQPCVFTEADRLGKRKGLPTGFAGLACRHCFGGYGSGRFFPSSIKTLSDTSKTLNVLHNHMIRCRKCPKEVREELELVRKTHDEERAKMKFGSQKAFFAKIWSRLHDNRPDDCVYKNGNPPVMKTSGRSGMFRRPVRNDRLGIDHTQPDGMVPGSANGADQGEEEVDEQELNLGRGSGRKHVMPDSMMAHPHEMSMMQEEMMIRRMSSGGGGGFPPMMMMADPMTTMGGGAGFVGGGYYYDYPGNYPMGLPPPVGGVSRMMPAMGVVEGGSGTVAGSMSGPAKKRDRQSAMAIGFSGREDLLLKRSRME